MRRSVSRARTGLLAVLLAAALTGGLLVAAFTFIPLERIAGRWPSGNGGEEVVRYARLFGLKGAEQQPAAAETWRLGGSAKASPCVMDEHKPGQHKRWFSTGAYTDTVKVRRHPLHDGGFIITFPRQAPLDRQRRVELLPAGLECIRAKYLEVLASELGLQVAEVSFVRMETCGEARVYLKREWMGRVLLDKRMVTGAVPYDQGFHPWRPMDLFPRIEDDSAAAATLRTALAHVHAEARTGGTKDAAALVERDAAMAWLLMRWMEGGPDPLREPGRFAYRWLNGKVLPLYVPSPAVPAPPDGILRPWAVNPFTLLLRDEAFRGEFLAKRAGLAERATWIRERFAEVDEMWLPVIAAGMPMPLARAAAKRIQRELLDERLAGGDPVAFLDRPMVAGAGMATFLHGMAGDTPAGEPVPDGVEEQDDRLLARLAKLKVLVAGDSIVFRRGKYVIDEDLVLPAGHDVVLLPGARFFLGPGANVVCRGSLRVRGTRLNPVFIRPQRENAPYGTFAVVGGGKEVVAISGLRMSGGSEATVGGMLHTAMLSIRGAASTGLVACEIGGSRGEDAVNIKGGDVLVRDCAFHDGHADLLDLDMVRGAVVGCTFRNASRDSNGDGLDVSASRLRVEGCRFVGMKDKGLSVGEGSRTLVTGCHFQGNTMGIAVKDLSEAHAEGNDFTGNGTAVAAYRKKAVQGGGRVHLYGNTFTGNGQDREVDEHSSITTSDAVPPDVLGAFREL